MELTGQASAQVMGDTAYGFEAVRAVLRIPPRWHPCRP